MGPEADVDFQSLGGGRTGVVAEFALLETDVDKAVAIIRTSGQPIEIQALHTHWVRDDPREFFLHVAGAGDAAALAKVMRQVLDATGY